MPSAEQLGYTTEAADAGLRWRTRLPRQVLWLVLAGCLGWVSVVRGERGQTLFSPAGLADVLRTAAAHYNAGQFAEAEQELRTVAPHFPGNFEINELAGLVYAARGKDQRANLFLRRAVKANPGNAAAHVNLGVNWARLGKDSFAGQEFKEAISIQPESYGANYGLGELYAHEGKPQAALPYLKLACQLKPSNSEAGYDLALAYAETSKFTEADDQIQVLLKRHNTAQLHNLLGWVEEQQHEFVASARDYQLAARMSSSEQNIFDWGTEMLRHWSFEAAEKIFAYGLNRYPKSVNLEIGLGVALFGMGRTADALRTFIRACDLAPASPLPYSFLAGASETSGEESGEITARLARYVQIDPGNARAHYCYALGLWEGGRRKPSVVEAVESQLKAALEQDPKFGDAYLELGILYASEERPREALREYQKAVEVDPSSDTARYRLGEAYARAGEDARAKEELAAFHRLHQAQLSKLDERTRKIWRFLHVMEAQRQSPNVNWSKGGRNEFAPASRHSAPIARR